MLAIPKKRLLVYAAAGLVVLGVGAAGLVAVRPSAGVPTDALVLDVSGAMDAAGSAAQGGDGLGQGFAGLDDPASTSSSTTVTEAPLIYVQVAGAVLRPGVYQMPLDARAFQAIVQAGGFADDADQDAVPLASRLSDGCRLYVPRVGEAAPGPVLTEDAADGGPAAGSGPVPINSATAEQLDALPGIGPALAQRIITYRETEGPFTSVDQLADVPGIGASKLEQLRPLVTL